MWYKWHVGNVCGVCTEYIGTYAVPRYLGTEYRLMLLRYGVLYSVLRTYVLRWVPICGVRTYIRHVWRKLVARSLLPFCSLAYHSLMLDMHPLTLQIFTVRSAYLPSTATGTCASSKPPPLNDSSPVVHLTLVIHSLSSFIHPRRSSHPLRFSRLSTQN